MKRVPFKRKGAPLQLLDPYRFGSGGSAGNGYVYPFYPTTAYSVRRRNLVYTGPCMRVFNASTNVESDIGFGSDGWLDEAALLAVRTPGTPLTVSVWYDQSRSSGVHVYQSTPVRRPMIVDATGVISRYKGKPAIDFNVGRYCALVAADNAAFGFGNDAWTLEVACSFTAQHSDSNATVLSLRPDDATAAQFFVSTTGHLDMYDGTLYESSSSLSAAEHQLAWAFNSTQGVIRQFVEGVIDIQPPRVFAFGASRPLSIGHEPDGTGTGNWTGVISEVYLTKGLCKYSAAYTPIDYLTGGSVVPGVLVAWNPNDSGADLQFSAGNLVAGPSSQFNPGSTTRATVTRATGKYYFEVLMEQKGASAAVGFATINATLSNLLGYDGDGYAYLASGELYHQSNPSSVSGALAAGTVFMVAADLKDGNFVNFWFGTNGTWLSAGDPAVGSNPTYALGSLLGAPAVNWFPATSPYPTGAMRARFTAESFAYPPPAGFLAWDGTTYVAPAVGFNPATLAPNGTLSTSNKSTSKGTDSAAGNARTFGKTGRRYFEIHVDAMPPISNPSSGVFIWPGWLSILRTSITDLTNPAPGSTVEGAFSEDSHGVGYRNAIGSDMGQTNGWDASPSSSRIAFCVDCDNGSIWQRLNESSWAFNNRGPAIDTGSVILLGSGPIAFQVGASSTASGPVGYTIRTLASEMALSIPPSFIAWDE